MPLKIPTVDDLLRRSADNSSETTPTDYRSHLALELIADALIGLLAELQNPQEDTGHVDPIAGTRNRERS
jgi:hypothetical protein